MAQQDACTLLDEQHNTVFRLFEQYKSAHDARHQQTIAAQISQELLVHMQIEDEIFYPAFRQATHDEEQLQDATHEHAEARELFAKIDGDRQNAKLMLDLEEAIRHHVNDEREKMFPEARKAKGMDLMQLAQQLEARTMELSAAQAA